MFPLTDGADTGSEQLRDLLPALVKQGLRVYPVRLDAKLEEDSLRMGVNIYVDAMKQ